MATSAAEMTPPVGLRDRVKRFALRGVLDRARPLAYRRARETVRCLTFHYLFPEEREHATRLFAALKREGDFVTTAELLALLDGPARPAGRLFHLSVDDGFQNVASEAHPILRAAGIPYALMVCPAFVGAGAEGLDQFRRNARYARGLPTADWDTLAALGREGVEIGAHTLTHREVSRLAPCEVEREVAGCRAAIEGRLGTPCTSFAWPFGQAAAMSEAALAVAAGAGYRAVFSSLRGSLRPGGGVPRYLPRHHFEPGWPIASVLYYATRAEPPFVARPLAP
ncbi:polysaccharide deacetylase family protein [Methylobacterium sp. NEAU 140]|uniref:polysaccharide deacetylase family protein n=1 Tax=Methylobacterium sp. NEAU 140 TaxID=3064945 RepID=UPI0027346FE0|nr:polysaccharide deacetylase family protein [Methylobacterium sp. NEAU 140]MDP4025285.1 polysaccharide deacetylase family protein [Methylobacterium sp. NEAU 140]